MIGISSDFTLRHARLIGDVGAAIEVRDGFGFAN
jgi:hypothetical protein